LIKDYYLLTKPGIIYGNALPALGGFFLAAHGNIDLLLLVVMILGLSFVIASACVFNNYIDRNIDTKMARTKNRALVTKKISGQNALIYASILGVLGFLLLFLYTNLLTTFIASVGFFFYVVVYGIWKRRSDFGTIVGSISGAVPPVVGYCAVTNQLDLGAFLLFLILVLWQMPHFYAIALFRSNDYKNAEIPVLPITRGINSTKKHMLWYIVGLAVAFCLLTFFGYTGYTTLAVMIILSIVWLKMGMQKAADINFWARKMFKFSLLILLVWSFMISINSLLP
jgi:protoheme IX farnesyltransferase